MTDSSVWLLSLLLFAHFLGDFTPLATKRMQNAKARGKPVGPIAAHAAVHAVLVGAAVGVAAGPGTGLLAWAAGIEFVTHFGLDWARGLLGARRPDLSNTTTQAFWSLLGVDQLAHGLVLIGIAWMVL